LERGLQLGGAYDGQNLMVFWHAFQEQAKKPSNFDSIHEG